MFHSYNNTSLKSFNILSLFSCRIIISLTGSCFTILSSFDLLTASAILFPKNSPALWTTYFEAVFTASSPISNNCFLYFLANEKNPYLFAYFIVLGSIEYRCITKVEERVISIY